MEFLSKIARAEIPAASVSPRERDTMREVGNVNDPRASTPRAVDRKNARALPKRKQAGSDKAGVSCESMHSEGEHDTESLDAGKDSAAIDEAREAMGSEASVKTETPNIDWIQVSAIEANPFQPRRTFRPEELEELTSSVREHGVLQPILLRPAPLSPDGRLSYQIVAGERRWRAAKGAGLSVVPAIIRAVPDEQALELAIIENVQRHDISAIDTALAYRRLCDEFHLSQEHVARRVGKSRSAVANTLRLLDLPDEARSAIEEGKLSEGHGRAILLISGEGARRALLKRALRDGLSVREVERAAQQDRLAQAKPSKSAKPFSSSDDVQIRSMLEKTLGLRVALVRRGKKGSLTLSFSEEDDLAKICALLTQSYVSRET